LRALDFLAIVLTAIGLVPGGAHVAELAHKIGLGQDAYLAVQGIYRGWSWFGAVLIAAIVTHLVRTIALRHRPGFGLSLAALVSMCVGMAIFFTWTYPVNIATANWTTAPENWQALRRQWEYSHAVNAAVTLAALCCVTWSQIQRISTSSPSK